jgi:ubiquinone/menaquinone biosynthesis C-methylase UbiE
MDQYTLDTQKWLDERFRETTSDGIYFAHQPIYGFGDKNSEPYTLNRYMITYHIMKALSSIEFKSLLDIGGAEGYKAAMVRELFGAEVESCDLSQEAVNRAKEIYNIEGKVIDIHNLSYESDQFDVVLCSETLEHVKDYKAATLELLRVAKKAVIITVPFEPIEIVQKNIDENIPHAHIHSLNSHSFDFTKNIVTDIDCKKILHTSLNFLSALVEAREKETSVSSYSSFSVKLYNFLLPAIKLFSNKQIAAFLLSLDERLSNTNSGNAGWLFVLKKEGNYSLPKEIKNIKPIDVINFKTPYNYII